MTGSLEGIFVTHHKVCKNQCNKKHPRVMQHPKKARFIRVTAPPHVSKSRYTDSTTAFWSLIPIDPSIHAGILPLLCGIRRIPSTLDHYRRCVFIGCGHSSRVPREVRSVPSIFQHLPLFPIRQRPCVHVPILILILILLIMKIWALIWGLCMIINRGICYLAIVDLDINVVLRSHMLS